MPLHTLSIPILRRQRTVTATFGTASTESPITGSPFPARVYRVAQTNAPRDEAAPGTATVDGMRRLSLLDPNAVIQTGDIALIPSDSDPAATVRAKVLRPRRYGERVQCDLEVGAE